MGEMALETSASLTQSATLKLSICIGTFNRAEFIGATLESIIIQSTSDCEIVVSNNASTDDTEQIVSEYARRFPRLRYFRQDTNIGLDRNFDYAVEQARGEYCWLMPDDDLLKPGAVARILDALRRDLSLILVNIEFADLTMTELVQDRLLEFESDRLYGRDEMDRLFLEVDQDLIMYIGSGIIKREIWLSRERKRYYDSLFIHVGMIFQSHLPGEALVIAEPLITYRLGNAVSYASRMHDIIFVKWPWLVESLALSKSARRRVGRAEPWRNPHWLLLLRAWGIYSLAEYRRWICPRLSARHQKLVPIFIAVVPGVLVNALFVLYYSLRKRRRWVRSMERSRFYPRSWRIFNRQPRMIAANGLDAKSLTKSGEK